MKYYWIVSFNHHLEILSDRWGSTRFLKNAVGPYFSYKEAMAVLYTWAK